MQLKNQKTKNKDLIIQTNLISEYWSTVCLKNTAIPACALMLFCYRYELRKWIQHSVKHNLLLVPICALKVPVCLFYLYNLTNSLIFSAFISAKVLFSFQSFFTYLGIIYSFNFPFAVQIFCFIATDLYFFYI